MKNKGRRSCIQGGAAGICEEEKRGDRDRCKIQNFAPPPLPKERGGKDTSFWKKLDWIGLKKD